MVKRSDLMNAYESNRLSIVSNLVAYHGVSMADAEDSLQDVMLRTLEMWEECHSTLQNWVPDNLPYFLFIATRAKCKDNSIKNFRRHKREEIYFGNLS